MKKTFAEFFAGIGLMRMGLELGGWEVVFANDIDEQKKEMYYTNFPDADEHFLLGDIHKIPAREIPTASLATASFPCTDLSLAGAREGLDGENSSAFWGFIKIIRDMKERRPPLLLIENVTGFLSSNEGRDFEDAMLALNDLGYAVDPIILDASRFVPQSRQRLFVVCIKQSPSAANEIHERFFQSSTRPEALADFIFSHPDINWKIRQLPEPPYESTTLEDVLENLPSNSEEWWSEDRALYLLNQMSQKHRAIADRMIGGRNWSYGTVFRRVRNERSMAELRTDGIAGCLRTPKGGSGRQILFKAGKGQYHVRLLTPRECARLMGADDFKIEAGNNQALFGFGDAVCVPTVSWIAENYLNPILDELYATEIAKPKAAKTISYRKAIHA
ncbi:MAG: DNA (cytosine-5-)-methyltransferase [Limisphaerales bacterium]